MSEQVRVLAVDLGATSVRVAAVDLSQDRPDVEVLHRWRHQPVAAADGSLRWDWEGIVSAVHTGLEAGLQAGPFASIGVDGWGVDYGLVDDNGDLVAAPFSYRDPRTETWHAVEDRIGSDRLYQITGIQIMGINTIFQLALHDREELDRARRVLLLPDLLVHELGGAVGAERSNVSTTGLMDLGTGDWSPELIDAIGLQRPLFPEVKQAGTLAGSWRGVPVHLVGSHDTASAFLGMPGASDHTVFVSTGSWVIVGVERPEADTSTEAQEANFSNEAGAMSGVRFLKNVLGFWLLERCRPGWGDPPLGLLMEEAAAVTGPVPTFDARDHRFLNPADMEAEIVEAAGLGSGTPRGVLVRSVLESIARGIAEVVGEIVAITGSPLSEVAIVGGGARASFFYELIAERTGLGVVVGSAEATALGNAIVQGIALGYFPGLAEARGWLSTTGVRL